MTAYGMERIEKILNQVQNGSAREIIEAVQADIAAFAGNVPQFDDITMLCLSFKKKWKRS